MKSGNIMLQCSFMSDMSFAVNLVPSLTEVDAEPLHALQQVGSRPPHVDQTLDRIPAVPGGSMPCVWKLQQFCFARVEESDADRNYCNRLN